MTADPQHLELRSLLQLLACGEKNVDQVQAEIANHFQRSAAETSSASPLPTTDVRIDVERAERCGFPEVIYAPGKSPTALTSGFAALVSHRQCALATRCSSDQATALLKDFPNAIYNPTAGTVRSPTSEPVTGRVVVVTAGTSDRPVAEEAMETLHWMHIEADLLMDVGVAGPQRFLQQKHRLQGADAVVVIAGMEGALPSVVAGWVACPVIAVPTSVGYGAALGGISALLGMLNSCAANVAVVNIDAGFKGAYLAGMIARQSATATRNTSEI